MSIFLITMLAGIASLWANAIGLELPLRLDSSEQIWTKKLNGVPNSNLLAPCTILGHLGHFLLILGPQATLGHSGPLLDLLL